MSLLEKARLENSEHTASLSIGQINLLDDSAVAASKPSAKAKKAKNNAYLNAISDLPADGWKDPSLLADSLWILGNRDNSGAHDGHYHGNFIPQIPNQLMRRFTRAGDVVLDTFLGSGTTMIEAKRLGRSCIGVELSRQVARETKKRLSDQAAADTFAHIIIGDCAAPATREKIAAALKKHGKHEVGLVVMHPPYHDIVPFSDHPSDLSRAPTVESFVHRFGDAVENIVELLADKHHLAIVIGDKYSAGEWAPLGFHLMNETLSRGASRHGKTAYRLGLKSVIVKNMANNRAKRGQENLWRYRAIKGGFYVFRHEYIFLFQKKR